MKKLIAVILSVLMLLPLAVLPSFAADEDMILTGDVLDAAVEAAAAELAGVPEGASFRVQSRVRQNAVAAKDLAKSFAHYIFLDPTKVEGLSDDIANDADYTVTTLENGKKVRSLNIIDDFNREILQLCSCRKW